MRRKITNPELIELISFLRKQSAKAEAPIWRDIADRLSRSKRRRIAVNISRINRYTSPGETIIIPGKVLGAGSLDHPVKVAAFRFSKQSREKIRRAKGACMTIRELVKKNPKGSGLKIIG